jgi:hypothetical protein
MMRGSVFHSFAPVQYSTYAYAPEKALSPTFDIMTALPIGQGLESCRPMAVEPRASHRRFASVAPD